MGALGHKEGTLAIAGPTFDMTEASFSDLAERFKIMYSRPT